MAVLLPLGSGPTELRCPCLSAVTGTPLRGAQSPVASSLSLLEMAPWAGQGWASCGLTTTEKHILEALD